MIKVYILVKATRKEYEQIFYSPYLARKFVEKLKYSDKLIVLGWEGDIYGC